MVIPEPVWSFSARKQLYQWYGHVHLLNEHAVGQWFALRRTSGECLWEQSLGRANTAFDFAESIILASETRSDGPWTADFGCYGISLNTGEFLWTWCGKGMWGRVVRVLNSIPGFTNELRTSFAGARGNECATNRGDILEIQTGRWLRRESDIVAWKKDYSPQSPSQKLYNGQSVQIHTERSLTLRESRVKEEKQSNGVTVTSFPKQTRPFGFVMRDSQQKILWDWSPEDLNLRPITNFYGWRLVGTRLLVLGGEEPDTVPIDPQKPFIVRRNPTRYHLLVVDSLSGRVMQRLGATIGKVSECRIEDADERGVLLSSENNHLRYYAFEPTGNEAP